MTGPSPDYYEQLSQQLREIRHYKQLSLQELSELTHFSSGHLSKVVTDIRHGSLQAIVSILAGLDHQLSIVPCSPIIVQIDLNFAHKILTNLKSVLDIEISNDFRRRVFGLLMGASYCALKSAEIMSTPFAPKQWDPIKLFDALETSIKENGMITFNHSEDLTLWVFGMYLKKLQSNLRGALCHCIYRWLRLKDEHYRNEPPSTFLTVTLLAQIEALIRHVVDQHTMDQLKGLLDNIREMTNPFMLLGRIEMYHEKIAHLSSTELSWSNISTLLNSDEITELESVAVAIQHVEFFERGIIAPGRHTLQYIIEWIMSIKALFWIGNFFRIMSANT